MIELKTCPFCGGTAYISESLEHKEFGDTVKAQVKCPQCGMQSGVYGSEFEAIKAWNARCCPTEVKDVIKPAVKYGERCPFCGHEGELKRATLELWYVECCYCEAKTGLYDYESDALDAWNDRASSVWMRHDDSDTWECSQCHACFDLDSGTPKDKYLNYCPVCGTKLELPN